MFFRIKVRALEPKTKREFNPPLEVISAPIKVISKPKQLKKRKTTKRRSLNDMLVETVQRIESQQQTQQEALEQLVRSRKRKATERSTKGMPNLKAPNTSYIDSINSSALGSLPPHLNNYANTFNSNTHNSLNLNTNNNNNNNNNGWDPSAIAEEEFAEALLQFFAAYEQLESEERPTKIRRVMRSCTSRETEELSELFRDMTSASFSREEKEEKKKEEYPASTEGCNCLDCPHKAELAKIDEFYKDFLASELPLMEEMEESLQH